MNAPFRIDTPGLAVRARLAALDEPNEAARIEAFLAAHPQSTPFHRPAWLAAVAQGTGNRALALVAEIDGELTGYLPLSEIHSPIFGRLLASSGFAVGGGVLTTASEAASALFAAAEELALRRSCPAIELRGGELPAQAGWTIKTESHCGFIRELAGDDEAQLTTIPRKQRAEVRKGLANPLTVDIGSGEADRAAHYAVYAESVRNLGTPVFPRALFDGVLDRFGDDADILTIRHEGAPVASVLSLYHRGAVMPYWGGGTWDARRLRANDRMYFELMLHARRRGCTHFDFGRSKTRSGAYDFKRNWGFEPEPLSYAAWTAPGCAARDADPTSAKHKLQIAVWQRLPLRVANLLGPWIARGLGMSGEILFIAHRIPFPPNRGDKVRSHHIVKRLAKLAPVHIACFADDDADFAEEVELATLAHSYCLIRRTKPLVLAGLQALAKGQPVSVVAFDDQRIADYVNKLVATGRIGTIYVYSGQVGHFIPAGFKGRVIVDFVDVDSAKFAAYAKDKGDLLGWIDAREARLLRDEEARLAARADVSLLVSREESRLFHDRLTAEERRHADVRPLLNGIDSGFFDPALVNPEPQMAACGGPRLIFTGQMDYSPNEVAAMRAIRRIMPLVRRVLSDASLHIVGRNPTSQLMQHHGKDGVHVWGRVDDIRTWIKGAQIALIPLEIARGIQNKVLEAMAMEVPVVLTAQAATGINAVPGHHFSVADSDEDIAAAVIELARAPGEATAMGIAARRFVVEQQSWAGTLAPLADIVRGTADKRDAA